MGTLKKHIQAMVIDSSMLWINPTITGNMNTPPYKNLSGTQYTSVNYGSTVYYNDGYGPKYLSFRGLTPVATSDTIDNYDFEDYEINGVGTTTYTTNRQQTNDTENKIYVTTLAYNVSVTNNTEEQITVKCIRFKGKINAQNQSTTQADYLFYSYYLDEPLVIEPNDTKSVSVSFVVDNKSI